MFAALKILRPESACFIYNASLYTLVQLDMEVYGRNLLFECDSANENRLLASINFWLEIERVTYDGTSLRLS